MYLAKYDLKGRTAVVTGGGQGIGLACSEALCEAGAHVYVADIDADRAASAAKELKDKGYEATGVALDVTRSKDVEELAKKLAAEHGNVDVLVNNAGVAKSNVKAEDTSDEHWRFHMDINVDGLFWCCREFGKIMLAKGEGSIVNIGSMSGLIANKPQPQSFYNTSKAAVHHLTKSLAAEWGERGVRVNVVAPTYIETPLTRYGMADQSMYPTWLDMTPMRRVGQPDEIASVVLFLASDAASLMTGAVVNVDGGYTCW